MVLLVCLKFMGAGYEILDPTQASTQRQGFNARVLYPSSQSPSPRPHRRPPRQATRPPRPSHAHAAPQLLRGLRPGRPACRAARPAWAVRGGPSGPASRAAVRLSRGRPAWAGAVRIALRAAPGAAVVSCRRGPSRAPGRPPRPRRSSRWSSPEYPSPKYPCDAFSARNLLPLPPQNRSWGALPGIVMWIVDATPTT
ncbi:hypothetical protein PVAP13_J042601 [Panicum virgatum]|nr:hypothetical protein PVAP13_J042601 [Panicum virgatum]